MFFPIQNALGHGHSYAEFSCTSSIFRKFLDTETYFQSLEKINEVSYTIIVTPPITEEITDLIQHTANKPIQSKSCHFDRFVLQTVKKEERSCQFVWRTVILNLIQSPRDSSRAECQCGCFMTRARQIQVSINHRAHHDLEE